MSDLMASAVVRINVSRERVWNALTDPELVKQFMFGADVETDWKVGSPILWKGEWQGKPFEDKGRVVEVEKPSRLTVTHFSPLGGADDRPENYHTIVYELVGDHATTEVRLSQDGNASEEEAAHSSENWALMLHTLKDVVEKAESNG